MRNLFPLLFVLSSCTSSYIGVEKEYVDINSLASTFVGSPDPMQQNPSHGVRLWMDWEIPPHLWQEGFILTLKVIYKDYEEETFSFVMDLPKGQKSFELLNEKYDRTGGLLTYMAEVTSQHGEVLSDWKHQMWFNLIE
ncbi:MAG: hypothetical protein HY860_04980 [Chlamydiales bacterium]|nr:hypothetical protein [Chlamydiales bacterium]